MTDDWFDLLRLLVHADVRFLVVGAHALAVHGVPRGTQDLDVWVEPTPENARRVLSALGEFGAPVEDLGVTVDDFTHPDRVVQIGVPPNRIDVLTSLTGISRFDEAWQQRVEHAVRTIPIPFLGRDALIATKRGTGRLKDRADLEALGELNVPDAD